MGPDPKARRGLWGHITWARHRARDWLLAVITRRRKRGAMGLTTGDFPPVDPATFMQTPYRERTKTLARHWAEYGFGAPKITGVVYIVKLLKTPYRERTKTLARHWAEYGFGAPKITGLVYIVKLLCFYV